MSGLNRYYRRSHITEKKFRLLIRYFAMDLSASQTALLSSLSRRTTNSIFLKIRIRLFVACQAASPFANSEVEVDESYFGARRVRGKRGGGASGKHIVFGIYKRWWFCVYRNRSRCAKTNAASRYSRTSVTRFNHSFGRLARL
jgi:hypothetical protein